MQQIIDNRAAGRGNSRHRRSRKPHGKRNQIGNPQAKSQRRHNQKISVSGRCPEKQQKHQREQYEGNRKSLQRKRVHVYQNQDRSEHHRYIQRQEGTNQRKHQRDSRVCQPAHKAYICIDDKEDNQRKGKFQNRENINIIFPQKQFHLFSIFQ